MRISRLTLCISILILTQQQLISQSEWSNLHSVKTLFTDTFILDTKPILPHSVSVYRHGILIDPSFFEIDYVKSKIRKLKIIHDSLTIYYRSIPLIRSSLEFIQKKKANTTSTSSYIQHNSVDRFQTENENDIQYSGSFVRGITVGNRQDASINSAFNLNLKGRMANGLEINATMTDANIPIQPEGNSASIQEFDRILIQLKKDSHQIVLGDFDVKNNIENYFLKFDRKLQGIDYKTAYSINQNTHLTLGATAAVTRGSFARNIYTAQENNQGPYKLTGNNGENFIIIIAGTERVFINGQLMKRGLENDYTINYNMGEVVFTPNRLITHDLRIVVEFQYSDRNYFRYSLQGNAVVQNQKIKIYSQIFTENDGKNQPINQNLTTAQTQRLSEIGNELDSANVISAQEVENWDATRILYVKRDTIVQGNTMTYYTWAREKTSPIYQVIFTQVGQYNGNYRLKATSANGTVYEWIAPQNGIAQGNYEPKIKLTTPKSNLQWTNGSEIKWNDNQSSSVELAYTDHDLNSFSDQDNEKNKGLGLVFRHKITKPIDSHKSIMIDLNQEYTSQYFSPLTRYRNNEFTRDWSLNLPIRNQIEQSVSSFTANYQSKQLGTRISTSFLYIPNFYSGIQSNGELNYNFRSFNFKTNHTLLSASKSDSNVIFYRPKASINYQFNTSKSNLELGLYHEINQVKTSQLNLSQNSFFWQNYFFKSNHSWKRNQINFEYIYRTEKSSDSFEFKSPHTSAHTFALIGNHEFNSSQSLKYTIRYRNFNSSLNNNENQHNYLARLDYNGQILDGMIRTGTTYEVKAGRELKMQMTYIKAPNGYGNYAWKDLNNNGIFELNEAYISPINTENNYVKFFIILPDYIPANEVNYTQFIQINPRSKWYNETNWKKTLSKLSYQLRWDINKKVRINSNFGILDFGNPLGGFQDSQLIFMRQNMFQQLSFQKNENKIGLDLEWQSTSNKNLLSNGTEGYSSQHFALKSRIEIFHFMTYFNKFSNGYRVNTSEYFTNRNYKIAENLIENSFNFYINQSMKINLNANYGFRSTGNQFAITQQSDLEFKLSRKNNGIIESKFTLMNLNYDATAPNPQVELALLNGLQRGLNYIWNATIGQKITKFLQLNLIYNGRKNHNSDIFTHSGNVEVRAIF